jgi:hypothetical protein
MPRKGMRNRVIFSVVVSFLLTVLLNWNYFIGLVPIRATKETLNLALENMNNIHVSENDLASLVGVRRHVPNYDTEIQIQLDSDKIELGNNVSFRIKIIDKGIVSLRKPYFYVFLLDPSKKAVLSFPDTIYSVSSSSRMYGWSTEDQYQGFYVDCVHYGSHYIPRGTLIEGFGKYVYVQDNQLYWSTPCQVVFQYGLKEDSNLIGNWRIYVFTYDEKYYGRSGNELNVPESDNFIDYSVADLQVTPKSLTQATDYVDFFGKYILSPTVFAVTLALNYLGIYPLLERHSEGIGKIGKKIRQHWIFVAAIIAIVIIQVVFFLL